MAILSLFEEKYDIVYDLAMAYEAITNNMWDPL